MQSERNKGFSVLWDKYPLLAWTSGAYQVFRPYGGGVGWLATFGYTLTRPGHRAARYLAPLLVGWCSKFTRGTTFVNSAARWATTNTHCVMCAEECLLWLQKLSVAKFPINHCLILSDVARWHGKQASLSVSLKKSSVFCRHFGYWSIQRPQTATPPYSTNATHFADRACCLCRCCDDTLAQCFPTFTESRHIF